MGLVGHGVCVAWKRINGHEFWDRFPMDEIGKNQQQRLFSLKGWKKDLFRGKEEKRVCEKENKKKEESLREKNRGAEFWIEKGEECCLRRKKKIMKRVGFWIGEKSV